MVVKLNLKKCSVMSISRMEPILYDYMVTANASDMYLEKCDKVKYLRVTIDTNLSFEYHVTEKVDKVHCMLGLIKRNFPHVRKESFILLYKSMVQRYLEYLRTMCDCVGRQWPDLCWRLVRWSLVQQC